MLKFVIFGQPLFDELKFVELSVSCTDTPDSIVCDTLLIDGDESPITDICMGWSFALFLVDERKIYQCGFDGRKTLTVPRKLVDGEDQSLIVNSTFDLNANCNRVLLKTVNDNCYLVSPETDEIKLLDITRITDGVKKMVPMNSCNYYMTKTGLLYVSKPDGTQIQNYLLRHYISDIACGKEHAIMLTRLGRVLSCGNGSRGQLGHGDIDSEEHPRVIMALEGFECRWKTIAAGGWHSAVTDASGHLYMWGWNDMGQLGRPCRLSTKQPDVETDEIGFLPKQVNFASPSPIHKVSLGARHSAAVLTDFSIWTWGWNGYGQLGHSRKPCCHRPTFIQYSNRLIAESVKCSQWGTIFKFMSLSAYSNTPN